MPFFVLVEQVPLVFNPQQARPREMQTPPPRGHRHCCRQVSWLCLYLVTERCRRGIKRAVGGDAGSGATGRLTGKGWAGWLVGWVQGGTAGRESCASQLRCPNCVSKVVRGVVQWAESDIVNRQVTKHAPRASSRAVRLGRSF